MKFFNAKKKPDEKKGDANQKLDANIENSTTTEKQKQDNEESKQKRFGFGLKNKKDEKKTEELKKIDSDSKTNLESVIKEETKKNLSTDKIKQLIEVVTNNNEDSIKPTINFEKNRITYPILKEIGEDEEDMELLENLSSNSVAMLDREISERLIVCPQHPEDLSVTIRMYCPECSSMDIYKLHLIEHKVCGYIAEKEEYGVVSVTDVRTCPNCRRQIKDYKKEIRIPGQWNKCNSCNKKFDNPKIKLHCRRFNHDVELTEVKSIVVPIYKIKADADQSVNVLALLPQLKKILASLGFTVEELSSVKGKSGVSHQTNIFARNNENKTVAVFIKLAKEIVDDAEVNSTLVNVLDIEPTWTVFIGIPTVSERAKAMVATHKMIIITGADHNKITSEIEKKLSEEISLSNINS